LSIPEISIVIPVYNEKPNLGNLLQRLRDTLLKMEVSFELIFVDDGSNDGTLLELERLAQRHSNLRYVSLSRNFGQQVALCAGLDYAQGRYVVTMDADLQDPPELISSLYQKALSGYEVVYAVRESRKGETWAKKWTANKFYRLLKHLTDVPIPVDAGDFRLMHRQVVKVVREMPEKHKFLRGQVAWAGFRQGAVSFARQSREKGETGYSYRKMFALALDALTAYSSLPIRFVTLSGFLVSGVAFLLVLYTYYIKVFTQDYVPGWASLMVALTFLGGVQLVGIGILGEYISRIYTNSKNRPLYIVKKSSFE